MSTSHWAAECWICKEATVVATADAERLHSHSKMNNSPKNHSHVPCDGNDVLVGSCACVGEVGAAHRRCLEQWVFGHATTTTVTVHTPEAAGNTTVSKGGSLESDRGMAVDNSPVHSPHLHDDTDDQNEGPERRRLAMRVPVGASEATAVPAVVRPECPLCGVAYAIVPACDQGSICSFITDYPLPAWHPATSASSSRSTREAASRKSNVNNPHSERAGPSSTRPPSNLTTLPVRPRGMSFVEVLRYVFWQLLCPLLFGRFQSFPSSFDENNCESKRRSAGHLSSGEKCPAAKSQHKTPVKWTYVAPPLTVAVVLLLLQYVLLPWLYGSYFLYGHGPRSCFELRAAHALGYHYRSGDGDDSQSDNRSDFHVMETQHCVFYCLSPHNRTFPQESEALCMSEHALQTSLTPSLCAHPGSTNQTCNESGGLLRTETLNATYAVERFDFSGQGDDTLESSQPAHRSTQGNNDHVMRRMSDTAAWAPQALFQTVVVHNPLIRPIWLYLRLFGWHWKVSVLGDSEKLSFGDDIASLVSRFAHTYIWLHNHLYYGPTSTYHFDTRHYSPQQLGHQALHWAAENEENRSQSNDRPDTNMVYDFIVLVVVLHGWSWCWRPLAIGLVTAVVYRAMVRAFITFLAYLRDNDVAGYHGLLQRMILQRMDNDWKERKNTTHTSPFCHLSGGRYDFPEVLVDEMDICAAVAPARRIHVTLCHIERLAALSSVSRVSFAPRPPICGALPQSCVKDKRRWDRWDPALSARVEQALHCLAISRHVRAWRPPDILPPTSFQTKSPRDSENEFGSKEQVHCEYDDPPVNDDGMEKLFRQMATGTMSWGVAADATHENGATGATVTLFPEFNSVTYIAGLLVRFLVFCEYFHPRWEVERHQSRQRARERAPAEMFIDRSGSMAGLLKRRVLPEVALVLSWMAIISVPSWWVPISAALVALCVVIRLSNTNPDPCAPNTRAGLFSSVWEAGKGALQLVTLSVGRFMPVLWRRVSRQVMRRVAFMVPPAILKRHSGATNKTGPSGPPKNSTHVASLNHGQEHEASSPINPTVRTNEYDGASPRTSDVSSTAEYSRPRTFPNILPREVLVGSQNVVADEQQKTPAAEADAVGTFLLTSGGQRHPLRRRWDRFRESVANISAFSCPEHAAVLAEVLATDRLIDIGALQLSASLDADARRHDDVPLLLNLRRALRERVAEHCRTVMSHLGAFDPLPAVAVSSPRTAATSSPHLRDTMQPMSGSPTSAPTSRKEDEEAKCTAAPSTSGTSSSIGGRGAVWDRFDVMRWFAAYIGDILSFSLLLPICGGFMLHYAIAPALLPALPQPSLTAAIQGALFTTHPTDVTPLNVSGTLSPSARFLRQHIPLLADNDIFETALQSLFTLLRWASSTESSGTLETPHPGPLPFYVPSLWSVAAHWLLGSLCLVMLVRAETVLLLPVLAPGTDLFFMRSVGIDAFEDDEENNVPLNEANRDPAQEVEDDLVFGQLNTPSASSKSCRGDRTSEHPLVAAAREYMHAPITTALQPLLSDNHESNKRPHGTSCGNDNMDQTRGAMVDAMLTQWVADGTHWNNTAAGIVAIDGVRREVRYLLGDLTRLAMLQRPVHTERWVLQWAEQMGADTPSSQGLLPVVANDTVQLDEDIDDLIAQLFADRCANGLAFTTRTPAPQRNGADGDDDVIRAPPPNQVIADGAGAAVPPPPVPLSVGSWTFAFAQVYDADPLRMLLDVLRAGSVELCALFLFFRFPIVLFRDYVWPFVAQPFWAALLFPMHTTAALSSAAEPPLGMFPPAGTADGGAAMAIDRCVAGSLAEVLWGAAANANATILTTASVVERFITTDYNQNRSIISAEYFPVVQSTIAATVAAVLLGAAAVTATPQPLIQPPPPAPARLASVVIASDIVGLLAVDMNDCTLSASTMKTRPVEEVRESRSDTKQHDEAEVGAGRDEELAVPPKDTESALSLTPLELLCEYLLGPLWSALLWVDAAAADVGAIASVTRALVMAYDDQLYLHRPAAVPRQIILQAIAAELHDPPTATDQRNGTTDSSVNQNAVVPWPSQLTYFEFHKVKEAVKSAYRRQLAHRVAQLHARFTRTQQEAILWAFQHYDRYFSTTAHLGNFEHPAPATSNGTNSTTTSADNTEEAVTAIENTVGDDEKAPLGQHVDGLETIITSSNKIDRFVVPFIELWALWTDALIFTALSGAAHVLTACSTAVPIIHPGHLPLPPPQPPVVADGCNLSVDASCLHVDYRLKKGGMPVGQRLRHLAVSLAREEAHLQRLVQFVSASAMGLVPSANPHQALRERSPASLSGDVEVRRAAWWLFFADSCWGDMTKGPLNAPQSPNVAVGMAPPSVRLGPLHVGGSLIPTLASLGHHQRTHHRQSSDSNAEDTSPQPIQTANAASTDEGDQWWALWVVERSWAAVAGLVWHALCLPSHVVRLVVSRYFYEIVVLFHVELLGFCIVFYPVQRWVLALLVRPLLGSMANLFEMHDFFFDADRLRIFDEWLYGGGGRDGGDNRNAEGNNDGGMGEGLVPLVMPPVPIETMFVRRDAARRFHPRPPHHWTLLPRARRLTVGLARTEEGIDAPQVQLQKYDQSVAIALATANDGHHESSGLPPHHRFHSFLTGLVLFIASTVAVWTPLTFITGFVTFPLLSSGGTTNGALVLLWTLLLPFFFQNPKRFVLAVIEAIGVLLAVLIYGGGMTIVAAWRLLDDVRGALWELVPNVQHRRPLPPQPAPIDEPVPPTALPALETHTTPEKETNEGSSEAERDHNNVADNGQDAAPDNEEGVHAPPIVPAPPAQLPIPQRPSSGHFLHFLNPYYWALCTHLHRSRLQWTVGAKETIPALFPRE